jgi:uncharacterized membrane protein YfcA
VTITDFLPLLLTLLASGVIAGVIAGLLGVGGGIVTVPVLEYMLRFAHVEPEWRMHVAVATSLAAIIPTAIASTRAHHARGAVDWSLAKSWAAPMLIGALTLVFGVVAAAVAIKMALPLDHLRFAQRVPRGVGGGVLAALIGSISVMMGIGGGTISVPTMTLSGEPIHRAVGTAALFGLVIGLPGTIGFLLARPGVELPWATVGLVSLVGVAVIAPGTVLTAPLGAFIAHRLDRRQLSMAFGFFLFIVATRMLWRSFAAA